MLCPLQDMQRSKLYRYEVSHERVIRDTQRRRKGRGALHLRIAALAENSELQSFVRRTCTVHMQYPCSTHAGYMYD
ncbi:hypothetical protein EVAR_37456_1 [Eumeta japonica]|uniref:Uncharacterized protein n=1 Tax=Eumeta variegata TaxID=151549 RepID=A0A4C1X4K2_EUMVA|nr:hypothetical protein EVAR_37456_1 [Eumeta japonica]